ncbi:MULTISPECIES: HNH endonuclease [unclassified Nocardioides]|uniref:HNH endonuclease n=1 Tax=unclassified Nocardioides TaxID=2615069 RepID=UPI0030154382
MERAAFTFSVVEQSRPEPKPRSRSPRKPTRYVPNPKVDRTFECANCEVHVSHHRLKAFCSIRCKEIADTVRYRRSVAERFGDSPPEDVLEAVRTKMAFALSATGYDQQGRRLSDDRRAEVWERDGGLCVHCGEPGEEIDHIDGSSPDFENLRLLCHRCHQKVTESHFRPVADDDIATKRLILEIEVRVVSPEPLQDSDAAQWGEPGAWQRWVRGHEVTS